MPTVSVNAPKTPVTKGSNGIAAATLPNVCKMPGPPAPFVPVPLPNIGMSGNSPLGYSTTVQIEGNPVAIQGSSFLSKGDIASMGTGGGIVSNNAEGPTTFIGPGSLNVQIEGKNVQLLGDPMLNNNGPPGSPPNSATMGGVVQSPLLEDAIDQGVYAEVKHICDVKCMCQAAGQGQACISATLAAEDKALTKLGVDSPIKPEVPFNMNPPGGGSPTPYMSTKEPWRATTRWWIKGSRRPDCVIVKDSNQPFCGDNINAVVEVKLGKDNWGPGQEKAYQKIAGGEDKLLLLDDSTCKCDDNKGPPIPIPVPEPVRETDKQKDQEPDGWHVPDWVVPALAATAFVAGCVALAITAPAWVPLLVGGAVATAGVAVVLGTGSAQPTPETA